MAREMGAQEEIIRLRDLQNQMEKRIQSLMRGGVPMGARPGMGQNVGPDRPPRSRHPVVADRGQSGLLTVA